MKFFLDNNLSPRLARAIQELVRPDHVVVHLRDKFPDQSISDRQWLEALAKEGRWVIISADMRIARNPHERKAWQQAKLTAFFLKKGWQNHKPLE